MTDLVTDDRAVQYWDAEEAVIGPYTELLDLTGPCAGIFMIFEPGVIWERARPPQPDYVEDAHARQYDRPWPQFDVKRFSDKVRAMLSAG